jgi:hypothetical protein
MNEWGFTSKVTIVGIGKSATINKFKEWCGLEIEER